MNQEKKLAVIFNKSKKKMILEGRSKIGELLKYRLWTKSFEETARDNTFIGTIPSRDALGSFTHIPAIISIQLTRISRVQAVRRIGIMTRRLFPFLDERPVPFTDFSSCHVAVTKAFAHANAPVYPSCLELHFRGTSLETGRKISGARATRRSQQSGKTGRRRGKIQIGRRVARPLSPLPQDSLFRFPADDSLDTLLEHPLPAFVAFRNFITMQWSIQRSRPK